MTNRLFTLPSENDMVNINPTVKEEAIQEYPTPEQEDALAREELNNYYAQCASGELVSIKHHSV